MNRESTYSWYASRRRGGTQRWEFELRVVGVGSARSQGGMQTALAVAGSLRLELGQATGLGAMCLKYVRACTMGWVTRKRRNGLGR
jgi:hypothetical protein